LEYPQFLNYGPEYLPNGNLLQYRKNNTISPTVLFEIISGVAAGMLSLLN
jgi:hypothetical protein